MTILDNDFVVVEIDTEKSYVSYSYKPEKAEWLKESDFKEAMLIYGKAVQQYQPTKLLVDNRALEFIISPDLQTWVAQEIAPLTLSLQRLAFVVSEDIFAQISMEQMMEEKGIIDQYDVPQYFQDREKAIQWLFGK